MYHLLYAMINANCLHISEMERMRQQNGNNAQNARQQNTANQSQPIAPPNPNLPIGEN